MKVQAPPRLDTAELQRLINELDFENKVENTEQGTVVQLLDLGGSSFERAEEQIRALAAAKKWPAVPVLPPKGYVAIAERAASSVYAGRATVEAQVRIVPPLDPSGAESPPPPPTAPSEAGMVPGSGQLEAARRTRAERVALGPALSKAAAETRRQLALGSPEGMQAAMNALYRTLLGQPTLNCAGAPSQVSAILGVVGELTEWQRQVPGIVTIERDNALGPSLPFAWRDQGIAVPLVLAAAYLVCTKAEGALAPDEKVKVTQIVDRMDYYSQRVWSADQLRKHQTDVNTEVFRALRALVTK